MSKWIAEFDLEDGDTMPEHMDLEYKGSKLDFHCRPMWIPCSERLPQNKETVLVTFKHFVSGNTIGLGSMILLRGKPHWHVREQNLGTYDVLAWIPLPEPYKAESEEE